MDEFTIRQIEAIIGLYSHPDVSKFIYIVLTNFETPVIEKYLKKDAEVSPFMQSWQNKPPLAPRLTRTNTMGFLPGYPTMDTTQGGFVMPSTTSGGFVIPGQQPGGFVVPGQQPGGFVIPGQQPGGFVIPGQQNNFVIHAPQPVSTTPGGFVMPGQSDLKKQDDQIFVFTKDMIDKKSEITFKCSIAYNDITNKKMFISKKFKGTDVILPENYVWKNDDESIFNTYILPLFRLGSVDKTIMYENHLFLCCFEDLLKNVLVPCINQTEDGMEKIVEAITLPVLLAFENELMNSKYRLNLFLMKKYSMDANSLKYNLSDSYILERVENKSIDVKPIISRLIDKLNVLFAFSSTLSKNE